MHNARVLGAAFRATGSQLYCALQEWQNSSCSVLQMQQCVVPHSAKQRPESILNTSMFIACARLLDSLSESSNTSRICCWHGPWRLDVLQLSIHYQLCFVQKFVNSGIINTTCEILQHPVRPPSTHHPPTIHTLHYFPHYFNREPCWTTTSSM